jgi:hypothetical protein
MSKKIDEALQTLRDAGYYVENLWSIYDIDDDNLDKEEKLEVLHNAIHRDYIYERINDAIHDELLILKNS